jgi:hypothetical protein
VSRSANQNIVVARWLPPTCRFTARCPNCKKTKKYNINLDLLEYDERGLPSDIRCDTCGFNFIVIEASYPIWPFLLQSLMMIVLYSSCCLTFPFIQNTSLITLLIGGIIHYLLVLGLIIECSKRYVKKSAKQLKLSKVSRLSGYSLCQGWMIFFLYMFFIGVIGTLLKSKLEESRLPNDQHTR